MLHTKLNLQQLTHFVDLRSWNVSVILPEDDLLRIETCWNYSVNKVVIQFCVSAFVSIYLI